MMELVRQQTHDSEKFNNKNTTKVKKQAAKTIGFFKLLSVEFWGFGLTQQLLLLTS
jgi:hypothetical protein